MQNSIFLLSINKLNNMEKQIEHQLKIKKVREMKNPTILMNDKDFESFKKEVESKVNNLKIGDNTTYGGFPIIVRDHFEQGRLLIYDNSIKTP